MINLHIYPDIYPYISLYIGVRVYPYGIFNPWAHWDGAWMGLENSSAAGAVAIAAAAVAPPGKPDISH